MNRRGFLKFLTGAATTLSAGGLALLEQELWEPTKTIVLPPIGGWVGGRNTLLTLSMITQEALKVLSNELVIADKVYATRAFNGLVEQWGTGSSRIMIGRPPRYT